MLSDFSNFVIDACGRHVARMESIHVPPAKHGIYRSEMLAVCALAQDMCVNRIVESGRKFGHSTHLLSKWFPPDSGVEIISIDNDSPTPEALERVGDCSNVQLVTGDGCKLVTQLTGGQTGRCVVLLDGPKYAQALEVARQLIGVAGWVFIHDMNNWDGSGWDCDRDWYVTGDARFKSLFSHLDAEFLLSLGHPVDSPGGGLAVLDSHA